MKHIIYYRIAKKSGRVLLLTMFCMQFFLTKTWSQVDVVAGGTTTYSNLKLAFDAINAGSHTGAITINITGAGTYTDPAASAVLRSSGAGSASYSSILIQPTADGVSIFATTVAGRGAVELKGADNVTINGDNPNTAGTNRNLTIQNLAANTINFTSAVRIATAATVVTSADGNTIKNCNILGSGTALNGVSTLTTAPGNTTFGIYCGGNGGSTATDDLLPISNVTTNTAPSGTTINSLIIDNNTVNACARGIEFSGGATTVSNLVTITNNLVGDQVVVISGAPPFSSPATTVYTKGIWIAGTNGFNISGNTLNNIMSTVAIAIIGIEVNANIGTGTINISNNTISNLIHNQNGGNIIKGILLSSAGGAYTIAGNNITNLQCLSNSSAADAIEVASAVFATSAFIESNKITAVYNRFGGNLGVYGINLTAGSNITVRNNFISDIKMDMSFSFAGNFGTSTGTHALRVSTGTGHKIYHNSIHLSGTPFGTATQNQLSSCLTLTATTVSGADVRNNILSNTMIGGGGASASAHVSIFLPSGATSAMNLTLNNNAYYCGGAGVPQGIAQVGTAAGTGFYLPGNFNPVTTSPASNFRAYTSGLSVAGTNDNSSIASVSAAPFTSATNLHIPAATPTQLESAGATTTTTIDIDNEVRPGPAGSVNGGATAPDMGADEFDGIPVDQGAPVILYTPLLGICSTGDRTLTASISDASGVPVSGSLQPRIYYKKNAGTYFSSQGVLTSGTGINGTWTFTIVSADMGGLTTNDLITYYVIVQDIAGTPNIASNPSGAVATDVNNIITPPPSPNSYLIQGTLSGTFTVGAGQNYNTLTDAVFAYNNSCLTGPVTFSLTDASYPSETFPVTINANPFSSATNTLTIRPATGVAANITGSSSISVIKINGGDYITIDGLNTGGSSLSLTNTNSATTSAVIWIGSTISDGATNNAIKNCSTTGDTPLTTFAGIYVGSGTTSNTAAETSNSNLTISGCTMIRSKYGINANGNASMDANWLFSQNSIGSSNAADKPSATAIILFNAQNFTVSGNIINGLLSGTTVTASGIGIFGNISGGTISGNKISDVKNTNNGAAQGSNGISLNATTTASNISIYNNFVWDIASFGSASTSATANGWGIVITGGGGYNIYYNTVYLKTDQTFATGITAAINITNGVSASGAINLRNNILANKQLVGSQIYSIICSSPIGAAVFTDINYNDYYFTGPNLGTLSGAKPALTDWQLATGKDANSKSVDPSFVSNTDLHLVTSASVLDSTATPIAGITTDIDGDVRSATFPDIGADEFNYSQALCTGTPTAGTINSNVTLCPGSTTTLTISGYTIGVLGITFQWEESDDNGVTDPWSNVTGGTGATTFSYTTAAITSNIYFRCKVTCSNSTLFAYTNVCTVAVTPFTLPQDFSGAFAPACWTNNNPTYIFQSPASAYGVGTGSAEFNFYSATFGAHLDLTTPQFTATPAGYKLSFDYAYAASSGGGIDSLEIMYSTNGGSSYSSLQIYPGGPSGPLNTGGTTAPAVQYFPSSTQWGTKILTLPAGTNKVRFRGTGNFGNNLYIDNVNIAAPPPCITPPVAGTAGGPSTGCTASTITYTVTAGSGKYQWQQSYNSGAWFDMVNDTNATLNFSTQLLGTYQFRNIRTSPGCNNDTTNTVTTTIASHGFTLAPVAAPASVCPGNPVSLSANPMVENYNASGNVNVVIPDNNATGISSGLAVSGMSGNLNGTTIRIKSVSVNISHLRVSDLDISLIGPNNDTIDLSSGNGGSGFDYTGTVFDDGAFQAITSGTAPFTGTYLPEEPLSDFTGVNPNGTWTLRVKDHATLFIGTLLNWTIVFTDDANGLTYTWTSTPAGFTSSSPNPTDTPTDTITYHVTVTNGVCPVTANVPVQILAPAPTPYIFPTDTTLCTGSSITIVTRDSGAYQAGWPAGTTFDFGFGPGTDSTFFINGPGLYNAYVSLPAGMGGCAATSPNAGIQFNDAPVLALSAASALCYGTATGSITADVALGTPPYRYLYYDSTGTVVRDFTTSNTSDTMFNLPIGQYCVVVYDGASITATTPSCHSDSLCIDVDQPEQLAASETHTSITCAGGTSQVTISATGGTSPYSGTGVFSQSAGSFSYTVTDANGCTSSVTVVLTQPEPVAVVFTHTDIPCTYSTANVATSVSGGTGPYSYQWSNASTNASLAGAAAGTYTVTVTDSQGCSTSGQTVVVTPGILTVNGTSVNVVCRGVATGSITPAVTGGVPSYTYLWNGGFITPTRAGLAAGTYTVTVTDANGCTKTKTWTITQPATVMVLNTSKTNVRCAGFSIGQASVSPAGGTAPYTYSWNTFPVVTTASVTGLAAGVYTCTVTDNIGCTKSVAVTITEPPVLSALQSQSNVSFPGGNDGSATVSVTGGTPGYTYLWNTVPAKTTATITGLTAGTYKCTVTDSKGCLLKLTFIITQPISRMAGDDTKGNAMDFTVSPNPSSGMVLVSFNEMKDETFTVSLVDLAGRTVFRKDQVITSGMEFMFDFSAFPKGTYFLTFTGISDTKTKRIVIE